MIEVVIDKTSPQTDAEQKQPGLTLNSDTIRIEACKVLPENNVTEKISPIARNDGSRKHKFASG